MGRELFMRAESICQGERFQRKIEIVWGRGAEKWGQRERKSGKSGRKRAKVLHWRTKTTTLLHFHFLIV